MTFLKMIISALLIWTLAADATSSYVNTFGQTSLANKKSSTNCTDYDEHFYQRWISLSDAIRNEDLLKVIKTLKEGICIRCVVAGRLNAPLHLAAEYKSVTIVKTLIDYGALVDCETLDEGKTPLHFAARSFNLPVIKYLINTGAPINSRDSKGITPLHDACISAMDSSVDSWIIINVIRELVARGALINTINEDGRTPLSDVVNEASDNFLYDTLLELGADVNFTSTLGLNILHEVVYRSFNNRVPALIKRNVCLDCQESNGWTALHFAAMKGEAVSTQYLIDGGASINIRDHKGLSPLYYAKLEGNFNVAKYIESKGGKE